MKSWSLVLIGAGVGGAITAPAGEAALLPAIGVIVVGLLLLAVSARSRSADRPVREGKPALSGLGPRVEGILTLAEEQAADRIAEAEATAAQIEALARAEADRTRAPE